MNLEEILLPGNSNNLVTGGLMIESILDLRIHEFFFIFIYFSIFLYFIKILIKKNYLYKNQIYFIVSYHYIFIISDYIYSLLYVNDVDTFFQFGYIFGQDQDHVFKSNNYLVILNHY